MSNGNCATMSSEVLRDLFECIGALTSKDAAEHSSATELQFDSVLQEKLEAIHCIVGEKPSLKCLFQEVAPSIFVPLEGTYKHVLYLEHCLTFFNTLATLLRETDTRDLGHCGAPKLSPNTLSISQQQHVQRLLQFIVGLGIHPNLLPGVGVPSKIRRSGDHLTPCRSHRVLVMTVKTLLNCMDIVSLWNLVIHKHLVDLLAALIQLCHAPIRKIATEDMKYGVPPSGIPFSLENLVGKCRDGDVPDTELIVEMHSDRVMLTKELNRLLESTFQPLLVRDLLLLMSYPMLLQRHPQLTSQKLPKWLKTTCGQILSASLLRKDGLSRVILGVVDAWSMSSSGNTPKEHDWMKCDALARTVANVPNMGGITAENYYERMGPQVVELVHRTMDRGADRVLCVLAHGILGAMLESQPHLSSSLVLRVLFDPLLQCMMLDDTRPEHIDHEISEKDFSTCIDLLHKISCNMHLNQTLLDAVVPLLPVLYEVHVFTQNSVSYVRSACETIISSTLASQDTALAVSILHWCVFREKPLQQCGSLRRDITFVLGAEGGIKISRASQMLSEDEWVEHVDKITLALRSILEKESCKDVVIDFFLSLLKKLNTLLKQSTDIEGATSSSLLETEARSAELRRSLLLLHLVQGLSDVAAEGLPQNLEAVVAFVQETLDRGLQLQREQEGSSLASQSVLFSLTILGIVLANFDMGEGKDISSLQKCLPSLSTIANEYQDTELRKTARNLHLAIVTHGVVSASTTQGPASSRPPGYESDAKIVDHARLSRISDIAAGYGVRVNVQPYEDFMVDDTEPKQYGKVEMESSFTEPNFGTKETSKTPYEEMWPQLQDPLIPVRGHAFISLRKLVEQRDAETLKNRDVLVETCHAAIQEGDSYIYLSAIQALAAFADENTDAILHVIANEMVSEKLSIEARLNLGEVLLRTCRNLGEMAPKYRNLLVNCFLCATKDPDPVIRASGASNLGELCGKLGYSFTSITQEVLSCLRSLMKTDPENAVKRSAVLAVASLVKGMGSKLFTVIPEELKALHRELKQLYSHTSDDIVRLQAQLAIEELNRVTREFLTLQPTLEKTIRILDFPH